MARYGMAETNPVLPKLKSSVSVNRDKNYEFKFSLICHTRTINFYNKKFVPNSFPYSNKQSIYQHYAIEIENLFGFVGANLIAIFFK